MDSKNDGCILKNVFKGHKKPVIGLTFDPTDKQFASCSEDKNIMVWNMEHNVRSYCFMGHSDVVTGVEYSPNGRFLASCSQDQTVRIWIPTIKGTSTVIKAHTSAIRTVAFSPDSDKIITGSNDKSLKLWNVNRKQFLMSFVGHNNWIRRVQFSSDGQMIASCADDHTFRIWDAKSGQSVHVFNISSKGNPTFLSLHNSGNYIAVSSSSGSIRVYDIKMKKISQHYVLHDYATSVWWHPTANFFLTSGKDGKVNIVDAIEGRPLYTIRAHEGRVNCVRFNHSGDLFGTGGDDTIMLWKSDFTK